MLCKYAIRKKVPGKRLDNKPKMEKGNRTSSFLLSLSLLSFLSSLCLSLSQIPAAAAEVLRASLPADAVADDEEDAVDEFNVDDMDGTLDEEVIRALFDATTVELESDEDEAEDDEAPAAAALAPLAYKGKRCSDLDPKEGSKIGSKRALTSSSISAAAAPRSSARSPLSSCSSSEAGAGGVP